MMMCDFMRRRTCMLCWSDQRHYPPMLEKRCYLVYSNGRKSSSGVLLILSTSYRRSTSLFVRTWVLKWSGSFESAPGGFIRIFLISFEICRHHPTRSPKTSGQLYLAVIEAIHVLLASLVEIFWSGSTTRESGRCTMNYLYS